MSSVFRIALFFLCCIGLPSHAGAVKTLPLVPDFAGFVESSVTDPSSGLPVHVKIRTKDGAPWLILIHGLGQNASRDWLPVLPLVSEHFQLLLFDLPGFGNSPAADTALTPEKYAALVHFLVSLTGTDTVSVAGHSLGGAIALRYAYDYPREVNRLLLINTAGILQSAVFAKHLSLVPSQVKQLPLLDPLVARGSGLINHVSGRLQDLLGVQAMSIQTLAGSDQARHLLYKDSGNINAALGLANADFSRVIGHIAVPVRLLWGAQDPIAPLRTGLAMQWWFPDAQLDILPGVGHVPMEEASQKTSEWLLNALQNTVAAPAPEQLGESQGDGNCKNQNNLVFRGKWRSVRLEHCANIRIENATLDSIVVIRSTVTLHNVKIQAKKIALEARKANITATGLFISGPQALDIDDSRLDLAAFRIMSARLGEQKEKSQFSLSLGLWCDGKNEWRLHGIWKPKNGRMDHQFGTPQDNSCAFGTDELSD
jgi:pimeloyl-ACP methyl ester carboxylesterase